MAEKLPIGQLLDLSGKTAIVTGGAVGIGRGIADRLYEAGANVVIADMNEANAQQAASELGERALAVKVNVARRNEVESLIRAAVQKFGGIDILVNNAGIFPNNPFTTMTDQDFIKVIDVNLGGVFLCTKEVSKVLIEQGRGGSIINITSIDAIHPSMIGLAHYDASKHAVWGFTKNIALELAQHNIRVNALAPGGVATPGVAAMSGGQQDPEAIKAFMAAIPMHRMGEPDDIGKVVLFLVSDMASYMTGSQVVVDGGALQS